MKKILICSLIILILILLSGTVFSVVQYLRIKYAKIEVSLVNDLNVEFLDKRRVSDFITGINGTIKNDYEIDTTKLGNQEIIVNFKNNDNINVSYKFNINVVDTIPPVVWLKTSYSVNKGSEFSKDKILCGDIVDNKPNCVINGFYDVNKVGSYPLEFIATDKSGNETKKNFTLYVNETRPTSNYKPPTTQVTPRKRTKFSDVVETFKNDNTKIGIDVSKWQGNIDFEKLKNDKVEFIIIRVGGTRGTNKEYFVDEYFKKNIEQANKYGIDVGIYFYSYANTKEAAINDANWVIEQIKDYKINLPIAFDWENWSDFNSYNLSFYNLTEMANAFLKVIEDNGYKGLLYSSKTYLENIWLPTNYDTWLAHYTTDFKLSNYQGQYTFWQMCQDGLVNGINADVDIDILYLN